MQVAKISKLLMCMERGVGNLNGKTLDELTVEYEAAPETGHMGGRAESRGDGPGGDDCIPEGGGEAGERSAPTAHGAGPSAPRRARRSKWSDEEKAAVRRQLSFFLDRLEIPGKVACERAIAAENALSSRTWKCVKYFVYNTVRAASK